MLTGIVIALSVFALAYIVNVYYYAKDKRDRKRQQPRAKMDYESSLFALSNNPQNTSLKLEALAKGRIYYSLFRQYRKLTTHDENAINNDLIVRGINK